MAKRKSKRKTTKVSKNVKKYVAKVMDARVEDKFVNGSTGVLTLTSATTDSITAIPLPAQGSDVFQRTGDKIRIKWIQTRTVIGMVNGSNSSGRVRIIHVIDKQANQAIISGNSDDQGVLPIFTAGQGFRVNRNLDTKDKFIVKKDKVLDLQVYPYQPLVGAYSSIAETRHFIHTMRFPKGLKVDFVGTGGTYASVLKNMIWQIVYPDLITAPNTLSYETNYTVCYEDA